MSTIVISGANRGLGLELARAFVARGATVIGACRRPDEATDLARVAAEVLPLDVGDERSIDAFVSALGDRPIDVLVNNAGIDARNLGASDDERNVLDQTPEQFMGQLRVIPCIRCRLSTSDVREARGNLPEPGRGQPASRPERRAAARFSLARWSRSAAPRPATARIRPITSDLPMM